METLPPEMIHHIGRFLGLGDLKTLAATSRRIRASVLPMLLEKRATVDAMAGAAFGPEWKPYVTALSLRGYGPVPQAKWWTGSPIRTIRVSDQARIPYAVNEPAFRHRLNLREYKGPFKELFAALNCDNVPETLGRRLFAALVALEECYCSKRAALNLPAAAGAEFAALARILGGLKTFGGPTIVYEAAAGLLAIDGPTAVERLMLVTDRPTFWIAAAVEALNLLINKGGSVGGAVADLATLSKFLWWDSLWNGTIFSMRNSRMMVDFDSSWTRFAGSGYQANSITVALPPYRRMLQSYCQDSLFNKTNAAGITRRLLALTKNWTRRPEMIPAAATTRQSQKQITQKRTTALMKLAAATLRSIILDVTFVEDPPHTPLPELRMFVYYVWNYFAFSSGGSAAVWIEHLVRKRPTLYPKLKLVIAGSDPYLMKPTELYRKLEAAGTNETAVVNIMLHLPTVWGHREPGCVMVKCHDSIPLPPLEPWQNVLRKRPIRKFDLLCHWVPTGTVLCVSRSMLCFTEPSWALFR